MSTATQIDRKPFAAGAGPRVGRFRAVLRFISLAVYFLVARVLSQRGAAGLVSDDWLPLLQLAMLAFLLLVGYAGFGMVFDRQQYPIAEQGLNFRRGWLSEAGLGLAIGWAIAVVCILPMMAFGGMVMRLSLNAGSIKWLLADAAYFCLQTLVVQIAFRGYPAACAARAVGEFSGVLMLAVLYGVLQAQLPGSSTVSVAVSIALSLLLSIGYLRSRALWLPWGVHFGWVASRALLFGLSVEGASSFSPVVQGEPLAGIGWTGGDFGLDGSWVAFVAMLLAIPLLYRATRELDYEYNAPVIVAGGIAVDLDAAARLQHESASRSEAPEVKPLVQILPASLPDNVAASTTPASER